MVDVGLLLMFITIFAGEKLSLDFTMTFFLGRLEMFIPSKALWQEGDS